MMTITSYTIRVKGSGLVSETKADEIAEQVELGVLAVKARIEEQFPGWPVEVEEALR